MLLFFTSANDGRSRRVDGFLAQVLQRRHNHQTFLVRHVDGSKRPDLAERFRITEMPTLLVVENKRVRGRLSAPRGAEDIQRFLAPWLR
jgi:Thioredoxin